MKRKETLHFISQSQMEFYATHKKKSARKPTIEETRVQLLQTMEQENETHDGIEYDLESVSDDGFFIYTTTCEAGTVNRWKAQYSWNTSNIFEVDFTSEVLIPNNQAKPLLPNTNVDPLLPTGVGSETDTEITKRSFGDDRVLLPIEFTSSRKTEEDTIRPVKGIQPLMPIDKQETKK